MDETLPYMVLKSNTFAPAKGGGLVKVTTYRVANYRFAGEEIVGKSLTEEEALALIKLLS